MCVWHTTYDPPYYTIYVYTFAAVHGGGIHLALFRIRWIAREGFFFFTPDIFQFRKGFFPTIFISPPSHACACVRAPSLLQLFIISYPRVFNARIPLLLLLLLWLDKHVLMKTAPLFNFSRSITIRAYRIVLVHTSYILNLRFDFRTRTISYQ